MALSRLDIQSLSTNLKVKSLVMNLKPYSGVYWAVGMHNRLLWHTHIWQCTISVLKGALVWTNKMRHVVQMGNKVVAHRLTCCDQIPNWYLWISMLILSSLLTFSLHSLRLSIICWLVCQSYEYVILLLCSTSSTCLELPAEKTQRSPNFSMTLRY